MKQSLLAISLLVVLAGCGKPPDHAFYNRGGPDALLDVSSEVVNLSVAGSTELAQLSNWIEQDQPSRAELYCSAGDMRCESARKMLESHGVPTMMVPAQDNMVALVYERILARDCQQRFIDNHNNNWNAPHASFGCSLSANIVQQVSDKQEFVAPNIGDIPRADGALAAYTRAHAARPAPEPYSVETSTISAAKSQ